MRPILLLIGALFYTINASATIIRVNNTGITTASPPNANIIYTTAQAAQDAAIAGDTLHIEPSGVSYGNLNITKKLTIIGNGYFLGTSSSNGNSNLQANPSPSKLAAVYFGNGSSNSQLTGCTVENTLYVGYSSLGIHASVTNITIKRNRLSDVTLYGSTNIVSNLVLIQNYIGGSVSDANSGQYTSFLIANNIISNGFSLTSNDNGIVQNNIIGASNTVYLCVVENSIVRNNVINSAASNTALNASTVQNNIASSASSPIGTSNGNQTGVALSTVFEDFPNTSTSWSEDSRFTLKTGSPALNNGYAGSDIGPILNAANSNNNMVMSYVLSGIPAIPTIYKLDAPAIVNGNTLNVVVSTRSNN